MNQHLTSQKRRLDYLLTTLWNYKMLWIAPAVLGFVLVSAYAFFLRSESWTARQSFIVRDDTLGQAFKPGRFESQESLQSAQETILEVARRPLVVRAVLEKLGPSKSYADEDWITDELIEDTQGEINFSAPNGAEFGKTEVIVLTAKASSRERTRKFIELLSEEIIAQVNRVRSLRLVSMEKELKQAYDGAVGSQQEAMKRLTDLDESLSPVLGVMNTFNDGQNLNSPAELEIAEIKTELRKKQSELQKAETVLAALQRSTERPEDLDLSSSVLKEQKNLEKMRDDLVAFRNDLAIAQGRYQDRHVEVRTLKNAIVIQQNEIRKELDSEIAGVQADIEMFNSQIAKKSSQIENLESRLIEMSKHRTEYLALYAQVKELTEAALRAKTAWGKTKSLAESARTVGLITPMDAAEVSSRPDGVGKKVLAVAGMLGGLMVGLGLVLLLAPGLEAEPASEIAESPAPIAPRDLRSEPYSSRSNSNPVVAPASNSTYSPPVESSSRVSASATPSTSPQVSMTKPAAAVSKQPAFVQGIPAQTAAPQPSQVASAPGTVSSPKPTAAPIAASAKVIKQPAKTPPVMARPVDLLKSAKKEAGFVQAMPKTAEKSVVAAPAKQSNQPLEKPQPAQQQRSNPFLQAISKPRTNSAVPNDTLAKTASDILAKHRSSMSSGNNEDAQPRMATPAPVSYQSNVGTQSANTSTISMPDAPATARNSAPTIQMDMPVAGVSDGTQGGVPEQIRRLTESIMQFTAEKSAKT